MSPEKVFSGGDNGGIADARLSEGVRITRNQESLANRAGSEFKASDKSASLGAMDVSPVGLFSQ